MTRPSHPPSPLVAAAEALEEELRRVGAVAREAQRLPLDSRKNLERTAASLGELGELDRRIEPFVRRLLDAVGALVAEQQAQAGALQARAEELQRRRAAYAVLVERYAALGVEAQALNAKLLGLGGGAAPAEGAAPAQVSLEEVDAGLAALIESARATADAASAEAFDELARDADALRQRLQASRNKLHLLSRRPADPQVMN